MRKIILKLLTIALVICCCMGLFACENFNKETKTEQDSDIVAVYNLYVANAESEGKTPLTYDEWLNSIKGEKGDKGIQGDKGDAGLSAYELYKKYHTEYTKTEEEFIDDLVNGRLIERQAFTILFDSNGGNEIESQTIDFGEKISKPETPTKEGYSFIGWFFDDDEWKFSIYTVQEDITLTAHWQFEYSAGLEYTLINDESEYEVTDLGTCTDNDIVIPSFYNGLPVTAIGDYAFCFRSTVTSVELTDNITYIGDFAFLYCSLRSITIPSNVEYLGLHVFDYCYKLVELINKSNVEMDKESYELDYVLNIKTSGESEIVKKGDFLFYTYNDVNYLIGYDGQDSEVVLPDSYRCEDYEIYQLAFLENSSIKSIEISNGVTAIGVGAFCYCESLENIVIPDSVTSIETDAFSCCYALESIYIGAGVEFIGKYLIQSCSSVKSIEVDENNQYYKSIDGDLYSKDGKILYIYALGKETTSFIVPDEVTTIYDCAFYGCEAIESITVSNNVKYIGESAFEECINLQSVVLGESVESLGKYVFFQCYSLSSIEVDGNNQYYKSIDGNLYTKDGKTLIQYAIGKEETSFIIPDEVTTIDEYSFSCSKLLSIEVPNSVLYINTSALLECSSLESIVLSDNLIAIGNYAFDGCTTLTSITLPSSLEYIGEDAFLNCYSLESIVFEDTETWHIVDDEESWHNKTNGTLIDVSNSESNVMILTWEYDAYYWYRLGEHNHEYDDELWEKDELGHWHACLHCTEQIDYEEHTPDYDEATTEHGICCSICGYEIEEKLPLYSAQFTQESLFTVEYNLKLYNDGTVVGISVCFGYETEVEGSWEYANEIKTKIVVTIGEDVSVLLKTNVEDNTLELVDIEDDATYIATESFYTEIVPGYGMTVEIKLICYDDFTAILYVANTKTAEGTWTEADNVVTVVLTGSEMGAEDDTTCYLDVSGETPIGIAMTPETYLYSGEVDSNGIITTFYCCEEGVAYASGVFGSYEECAWEEVQEGIIKITIDEDIFFFTLEDTTLTYFEPEE